MLLGEIGNINVLRFCWNHISKPEIYGCFHEEHGTDDDRFGSWSYYRFSEITKKSVYSLSSVDSQFDQ